MSNDNSAAAAASAYKRGASVERREISRSQLAELVGVDDPLRLLAVERRGPVFVLVLESEEKIP